MSKFKKSNKKELPAISTASLPDIIFILLFFFMVVTTLREVELLVNVKVPKATELTKIREKSLLKYIYVGSPSKKYQSKFGDAPRVQLNDRIISNNDEIIPWVEQKRNEMFTGRDAMTIALKVDQKVSMGVVEDVKKELRKANALKISYSATARTEEL